MKKARLKEENGNLIVWESCLWKKYIVYGVNILTGIQVSDFIESDSDRAVAQRIGVLTPQTYNQKCIFFPFIIGFPRPSLYMKKKISSIWREKNHLGLVITLNSVLETATDLNITSLVIQEKKKKKVDRRTGFKIMEMK